MDETPRVRADLNTASLEGLMGIPGIPPEVAASIVDYRAQHGPFQSVDDLANVPGVDAGLLEEVRPHVMVVPYVIELPSSRETEVPGEIDDETQNAFVEQGPEDVHTVVPDDSLGELMEPSPLEVPEEPTPDTYAGADEMLDPLDEDELERELDYYYDTEDDDTYPEPDPLTLGGETARADDALIDDDLLAEEYALAEERRLAEPEPMGRTEEMDTSRRAPAQSAGAARLQSEPARLLPTAAESTVGPADNRTRGTTPARQESPNRLRDLLFITLGGLLGVLLTLLILLIAGGTLNYAPRRLVDALDQNLGIMQQNQQATWARVDALTTRIDDMESRVAVVEALQERVSSLEAQALAAEEQFATLDSGLSTLGTAVDDLDTRSAEQFDALDTRVAAQEEDLNTVRSSVEGLQETVQEVEQEISRFDAFFSALRDLLIDLQGATDGESEDDL